MRRLSLLATAALTVTLLPSTSAHAAGETCQGRAATVVGSGLHVRGTEGPDVVVTNGAADVQTYGGDDLVCVTGEVARGSNTAVLAGDGDDVVDASAATGATYARLGAGSDTYTGSVHEDTVEAGDLAGMNAFHLDAERDTVATGTGADTVFSGSQGPSVAPNGDVVSVGSAQAEVSWWGPMTEGAGLTGGGGSRLAIGLGGGSSVLDAGTGTLLRDGAVALRWTGFDDFDVVPGDAVPTAFAFTGSERDEDLSVDTTVGGPVAVDLGGGDDALLVDSASAVGGPGSSYAGGEGSDRVTLWAGDRLALDLASGRMATRSDGRTVRARLTGFESSFVVARRLDLAGTTADDDLRFQACTATVRGRAGDDRIAQNPYGRPFRDRLTCQRRTFRLLGGRGDDVLRGSTGRDVLVGGPGRDAVAGGAGRDTCSGERQRSCEVRR